MSASSLELKLEFVGDSFIEQEPLRAERLEIPACG